MSRSLRFLKFTFFLTLNCGSGVQLRWQDIPINENHIKQLHQTLLRHSEKDERHRGQYKTYSNSVAVFDENGTQIGILFETATPLDTPRLNAELVE